MSTITGKQAQSTHRIDPGPSPSQPTPRRETGKLARQGVLLFSAVTVLAVVGYGSIKFFGSLGSEAGPSLSTYKVSLGELLITVTEDGTVESASNVDIKCQVAGGSSILWIVEDGKQVKKGEKLVELDASVLEDQINTQKITFSKARSADITAQMNYEVAQISVKEYTEGTFKKELQDAETLITIAEENLRSAKNSLEYSERMFQRGYISSLELESQQFAVKRSQLELDSANTAMEVLEKFTKVKMLKDLESQVETAEATMESEQAAFELEEAKLKRLETQLENCLILAPQDGMVVYANERGGRFGQQGVAVEEGATIRDRQTILRLPDLTQMQVKVSVHETKVEDLQPGMRAHIRIQGRELQGIVTSIANQHEATSFFSGNVKEYATTVKIDGEVEGLKPGMTAEVEILVAHLRNVPTLPISAVVEQRGQFVCWVKTPSENVERRTLVLGLSNDQFVEVKDGVTEGDDVIRNPRAVIAESHVNMVEIEQVDVNEKFGDAAENPAEPAPGGAGGPQQRGDRSSGGQRRGGGGRGSAGPDRGPRDGGQGSGSPEGRSDGGGRGAGGRGAGGQGERGGRGSRNLMDNDTDGDGRISKEEAPAGMQSFFDRLDGNGDGYIDEEEIRQLRNRSRSGGPGGGGGSRGGPG